jgi:predicted PurR-regulated permease PerM
MTVRTPKHMLRKQRDSDTRRSVPRGRLHHAFFWGLLLGLLVLVGYSLLPLLNPLIFAVILTTLLHPLRQWFVKRLGERRNLVSLTVTTLATLVIALPVFVFIVLLLAQAVQGVGELNDWLENRGWREMTTDPRVKATVEWLRGRLDFFNLDVKGLEDKIMQTGGNAAGTLLDKLGSFVGGATSFVSKFVAMVFILFFLVRDGDRILGRVSSMLPLYEEQKQRLFRRMKDMFVSVIVGNFITAVAQASVAGVGFAVVGRFSVLLTITVGVATFIPLVGTAIVFVPLLLFIAIQGQWLDASILAFWAAFLVGPIDGYVRPIFIGDRAQMSTLFIFLGILGGIYLFGLPGILYGPLLYGMTKVMLDLYHQEYLEEAHRVGGRRTARRYLPRRFR